MQNSVAELVGVDRAAQEFCYAALNEGLGQDFIDAGALFGVALQALQKAGGA